MTCTKKERKRERRRGRIYYIYYIYIRIRCLFRQILDLGLIRETLINTALGLAYYIQAGNSSVVISSLFFRAFKWSPQFFVATAWQWGQNEYLNLKCFRRRKMIVLSNTFYQILLLCVKESLMSYRGNKLVCRGWSWRMRFAYLNLCNGVADVVKAIAENSIVQYIYVWQYIYLF